VAVAVLLPITLALGLAVASWDNVLLTGVVVVVVVTVFPPHPARARANRTSADSAYHFLSVKYLVDIEIPFFRFKSIETIFSLSGEFDQHIG
jgi:hypothetical protein